MAKTETRLTAATADRHWLYERAVQNPDAEVEFFDHVFAAEYGRKPGFLREDFSGTTYLGYKWAARRPDNTVLAVDLDGPTLAWGRRVHGEPLGEAASRVTMVEADVRDVQAPKCDVLAATNFSWWGFHTHESLRRYFENCLESLRDEGVLVLDIYGGPEAQVPQFEEKECEGFTYIWDQDEFNPITHAYRCKIHFRFPDGSEMLNAFEYDWRLWTIPEVRRLLLEAGFRKSEVYWEGADEDGEPDGEFDVSEVGDSSPAWVAYIVAYR